MIDTKDFMTKAKAAKTFEIHPVWLKRIIELCDSYDELVRENKQLKDADSIKIRYAISLQANAVELNAQSNQDALESERSANSDLTDRIDDLERKLEIADDALTAILEKESRHDDLFNINVVFETGEIALEALKLIRGENDNSK